MAEQHTAVSAPKDRKAAWTKRNIRIVHISPDVKAGIDALKERLGDLNQSSPTINEVVTWALAAANEKLDTRDMLQERRTRDRRSEAFRNAVRRSIRWEPRQGGGWVCPERQIEVLRRPCPPSNQKPWAFAFQGELVRTDDHYRRTRCYGSDTSAKAEATDWIVDKLNSERQDA